MGRKKTADEVVISKLQQPKSVTKTSIEDFNKRFDKVRDVGRKQRISKKGSILLATTGATIEYESDLEKKILTLLDESENIIDIKTQSLELKYFYRAHDHLYYPDVVILSKTGHVAVIEVKDTISMFKTKTIKKYETMKEYCEINGYYYTMLNDKDDFETLITAEADKKLELYLSTLLAKRKSISWSYIKDYCKDNDYTIQQVMTVVYKNKWKIQSPKSRVWAFSIKK